MGEWKTQNGVTTVRSKETDAWGHCNDCFWRHWGLPNLSAARKAAHRHVQEKGHEVAVFQTRERVYGPQK